MAPPISVVLCTRNRSELLASAITSVVSQDFATSDYEIVVVDNGSTDGTEQVVRQFGSCVRYLREETPGLNTARNKGWRAATGQYIVFFDDDAIAEPGWLKAILSGFKQVSPAGVIGGPVVPIWSLPRPNWLADEIASSLTIVDWGPGEKVLTDLTREWLVGANMAVRKSLLCEIGGFHPWLDRVGNNLLSSGDVFLQKRAIEKGNQCLYSPQMKVKHHVPAQRLKQGWFEKRFYWQGMSDAVMHLIENSPKPRERISLAFASAKRLMGSPRKLASLISPADHADAFTLKCLTLIEVGFIAGLIGAAKH